MKYTTTPGAVEALLQSLILKERAFFLLLETQLKLFSGETTILFVSGPTS